MTAGFTFDGVHSSTYSIIVTNAQLELLPATRDRLQEITGMDGQYDAGMDYSARHITLDCILSVSSSDLLLSNMRDIAKWLDAKKTSQKLIFDAEPTKYYLARYAGQAPFARYPGSSQSAKFAGVGQFTVPFVASDPFAYSTSPQSIPWNAQSNEQTTLPNSGNTSTPFVIQIRAPATAQSLGAAGLGTAGYGGVATTSGVTITVGGVSVTYTGEIVGSDVVEIDTGNMTVKYNGVNALQYWSGDFPVLQPGDNTVIETDNSGVGANITFNYSERWI